MRNVPVALIDAPMTLSPTPLLTGRLSPVTIDSSTSERPSITVPSTGIRPPGRTRTASPTATSAVGTSTSAPARTTVAIGGASGGRADA
jgi:hypothetical protein